MKTTHTAGSSTITSRNPATGQVIRDFEPYSPEQVESSLALAAGSFLSWRRSAFGERRRLMLETAQVLVRDKMRLARTMTLEMGKPIRAAIQEVEKCEKACQFYAENAEGLLAPHQPEHSEGTGAQVRCQPLGPVLAVMPWNFPFWQVFRFAAPALMAGNVALLKHASNVPQCALDIAAVFRQAGFPEGIFQTLLVGSTGVTDIIADPRVCAVTLTGSVAAGASVAAAAGRHLKKTVLELGGSDPFIVMPSADLEQAVSTAVQARTINNGQSCIAAKRFIVHRKIGDEFQRRFVEKMASLKIGDPMDEGTDIGPLATKEVLDSLNEQVSKTVSMGARVLLGGKPIEGSGYYFQPTVLGAIPPHSPAYKDELFGPVASLFVADDLNSAIAIANDTPFGLGSCIWTNDEREREQFVEEIQAGMAFVNGMVASDPRVPFGGIKQSGYGRELSVQGIREFVNVKTVVVRSLEPPSKGSRKSATE
jgi:succinate-semialdehyde dehydrogenase/glutarate-semialdehyde dehydrogenase